MAIGQVLATAVSGLKASALKVNVAAANIVNRDTAGYKAQHVRTLSQVTSQPFGGGGVVARVIADGETGGEVDLAREFIRLIEAESAYRANAGVIRTAEDIERESVNLIA